jgi:hypothetical protein
MMSPPVVRSSRKQPFGLTSTKCLSKQLVKGMSVGTTVTAVMAHLFNLELHHWMIGGVQVFGLASFAQIKIGAGSALETNACNRSLLASITSNPMVNNLSVDRLTELEKRVFGRVH